jgi:tetratricopeptide (TPR) repeat protein
MTTNDMDKEYGRIRASGLTGDAMREALIEFEFNNPNHFNSKVDIADNFYSTSNMERALGYLLRAEKLVPKKPYDEEAKKYTIIMYALLGRIFLSQGEYDKAMDYAEKAVAVDDETGKRHRFLQAHILIGQQKQDEALALFYELYKTQRDTMVIEDVKTFMYLLAAKGRYSDCAEMVDLYFNNGPFYPGLGIFAASAFDNSGQPNKGILAGFLEYEYILGFREIDDSHMLGEIEKVENLLNLKGTFPISEGTLRLLRSLYDNSDVIFELGDNAFFAEDYFVLKKKILSRSLTIAEFRHYLQLQRYFTMFPVYYWNVWQAALLCSPDALSNYAPALEEIIRLHKNGPYAQPAREELAKYRGY